MRRSTMVKKKRNNPLFALGCGCGGTKSVSVCDSSDIKSMIRPKNSSSIDTTTLTITSATNSSPWDDNEDKFDSSASTPSFSGLLRELGELEQTVKSFHSCREEKEKPMKHEMVKLPIVSTHRRGHKRSPSEGVPVVKDSEDPLGDFRHSMLQMIVEKEIIDKDELCELLRRFLALNSPHHHHLILRAFSEIWEEVFAEFENNDSPREFLVGHGHVDCSQEFLL